jgi:hypothetical protein
LLVGADKSTVDVEFTVEGASSNNNVSQSFASVPVQRNHRTNIYGSILTKQHAYSVTITPGFDDSDHNTDVWDGVTKTMPTQNEKDEYVISSASELAGFAEFINNGGQTTQRTSGNVDFVLTSNIDLNNHAFTPIGTEENPYKGVFNGKGYTISNLYINTPSANNVGLFGKTINGEVKNLTINNATVSGRLNVGAVVGTPYTSKMTNITLTGNVKINGMAYVGGMFGKNAYANLTNLTINVNDGSYVNANSIEGDKAYRCYVGGVIGFMGEGYIIVSNVTSNINVTGTVSDVGGITGIAHYNNTFEDCSSSGNVTMTDAEYDLRKEIGGIAGVWHNANGTTVTFNNCSFTGTLSCSNGSTTYGVSDNIIVGDKYLKGDSNNGVLIIKNDQKQ